MKLPERTVTLPAEAVVPPSADDGLAASLRGFGPAGVAAFLLIVLTGNVMVGTMMTLPIGAALVLVWARLSRTPWREIGYVRPGSWIATIAGGVLFGAAFKLVMKALVMPLLGADPINHAYHFLAGNRAVLPQAVWAMLVAGFAEETVFRGYLFERFGKVLGRRAVATTAIVLITTAWFGAGHYSSQGLPGVEQALFTGLAFGTIYALTGRIFMVMCAHAAFDLTALAIIYWDLESRVAHLFL